jgi:hypothetical protein
MRYIYAVRDRYSAWAIIRRQPLSRPAGACVTLLGRCDDDHRAWDLFWAAHRLIADGHVEVPLFSTEAPLDRRPLRQL